MNFFSLPEDKSIHGNQQVLRSIPTCYPDHSVEYTLPFDILEFELTDTHIYVIDQTYRLLYARLAEELSWIRTNVATVKVSVGGDGLVWYVDLAGSCWAATSSRLEHPVAIADHVLGVELSQQFGILVKEKHLEIHADVDSSNPFRHDFKKIRTPEEPVLASASAKFILFMTVSRSIYSFPVCDIAANSTSISFSQINIPMRITSFQPGPRDSLFVIDLFNKIHFCFSPVVQDWAQASFQTDDEILRKESTHRNARVRFNNSALWTNIHGSDLILKKSNFISGHTWEKVDFKDIECELVGLVAANFELNNGQLSVVGDDRDGARHTYTLNPTETVLEKVETGDSKIIGTHSNYGNVYIDEEGIVYGRTSQGREIKLTANTDNTISKKICKVSFGTNVVFGLGECGRLYTADMMDGVDGWGPWQPLQEDNDTEILFKDVSAAGFVVWSVDREGLVRVREGVYPELPRGTGWIDLPDVRVERLSVWREGVWVVSEEGDLFRRLGVLPTNWIGEYWQFIPHILTKVTKI